MKRGVGIRLPDQKSASPLPLFQRLEIRPKGNNVSRKRINRIKYADQTKKMGFQKRVQLNLELNIDEQQDKILFEKIMEALKRALLTGSSLESCHFSSLLLFWSFVFLCLVAFGDFAAFLGLAAFLAVGFFLDLVF